MEHKLNLSSSPHIRSTDKTSTIMRDVVIALTPATLYGFYIFGMNAVMVVALTILAAVATEALMCKMRKRPITIGDWSAVVTGLLLAMNLPANATWWMAIVGAVFAIAIAKHAFGGLGHNFINPALAARAFLMSGWMGRMTAYTVPKLHTVSQATPLNVVKQAMASGGNGLDALKGADVTLADMFLGNIGGVIGETSALLLILGGLYLIFRGVITYRIPTFYIGTVAILTFFLYGFDLELTLYMLLGGGLMLGAFFMATDYASSPINPKGQIIFAIGCGLLTVIIRRFGGYPEGVSYSILLMNVAAPLIEKYSSPKVFGGGK
ncbi:RnfABCDGE type electron transport complex subunit D [Acidaminobacter sp. JC074]|uniref:RnfABCDGE type electron transport complex subunit D n=1 Tax=Acidaminobacter sp. JC074 TaxID=2530199 RepID=UPI001F0F6219|nr:RnfABCDGE type electron transport complex subunit D [Acidaminobacter sp. JC074]MCH4886642.1 RnfABCDGE type electron transport complex subunit D [Acidaminobacter sp. JC074]